MRRGFTIIELLVVIFIITILAGMLAPAAAVMFNHKPVQDNGKLER